MTDYADIVKRLRANLDKYPGFVNLNADAATAMETLLAQRAVLVAEVEAWRHHDDVVEDTRALPTLRMPGIRAHDRACEAAQRTDAAFPEGLTK